MTRRWISILSGGVAVTLLAGLGALVVPAVAGAIPDDGRIHACYTTLGGALRVVDEGTLCRKNETELSWSQEGSGGTSSSPSLWYTKQEYNSGTEIDLSQELSSLLAMALPDLAEGEGYLLTATFTLVNDSGPDMDVAADAGVTCVLGDLMGITDLMVLADGISPEMTALSAGGLYSSNRRSFTLTGISTHNGGGNLACAIANWTGLREMPTITFVGGYMTAQKMSLEDMSAGATAAG